MEKTTLIYHPKFRRNHKQNAIKFNGINPVSVEHYHRKQTKPVAKMFSGEQKRNKHVS